ncbi:MAG TPA: acyl-CoA dehydrogenase family protein [Actinocrinis sp.]|jgi:acyl-CoA dehydrogenase|uniref:acyl-CoA dehydrogenase family protein n=1 Tax=Actinocrinis sp. TaxID=1920516 RepID=UPI002D38349E|nr:acyl-CoA dehydrogenase family protein [Actinocrinis sp.]HZU54336.1 acyl-CoA dehydrogenase family protein [Actinocrinis sp.]
MDFEPSPLGKEYQERLRAFMDSHVYPAEPVYAAQRRALIEAGDVHRVPQVVEDLKVAARERGLWNLFLPDSADPRHGLSVTDYAPLAELTGRSIELAPEALNCAAPDTGNMEVLHLFGTPEQKERWLAPLLRGEIRSGFGMTEPEVASSDASNIRTRIERDGDEYVITGRKWWTSGAMDPRCKILIVMGKTDPDGPAYRQQSMVLVPLDAPGVKVVRSLPVFGYQDQHGHAEIVFDGVRVPASNLIGEEGGGFAIAQARLGPGRIHHCMRALGMAERALELMCERAVGRVAFGKPVAAQGVVQQWIAESRMAIEQARLLTLKTAWLIDRYGTKSARTEIAAIKVVAPRVALDVVDKAIQVHGGAGVSDDTPLAAMWAGLRTLRIADGPDEVHIRSVARTELKPYLNRQNPPGQGGNT